MLYACNAALSLVLAIYTARFAWLQTYIHRRVATEAHRVTVRSRVIIIAEEDPGVVDALNFAEYVLRREKVIAGDSYRGDTHRNS